VEGGHEWCRRVGGDIGNTSPKFDVEGCVRCGGQRAVKITAKGKWVDRPLLTYDPETLPLDHTYLRKGSTCLNINNFTLIYEHGHPSCSVHKQQ
jgi:hypothetical protein